MKTSLLPLVFDREWNNLLAKCFSKHLAAFAGGRLHETHKLVTSTRCRHIDAPRKTERSENGFNKKYQKRSCDDRRLGGRCRYIAGGSVWRARTAMYSAQRVIFHARERVAASWWGACGERRGAEPAGKSNEATRRRPAPPVASFHKNDVHPTY